MKGYTIQESIDLLEKAVENSGGSSGASTAADVSYSNTSSGLLATNVQAAIDELDTKVDNLETGHVYSTIEAQVGKWIDNSPVYEKTIECGTLPNNTSLTVAHGITGLDKVVECSGTGYGSANQIILPFTNNTSAQSQIAVIIDATNITIRTGEDKSSYTGYITLRYTKTAPTRTSKKK